MHRRALHSTSTSAIPIGRRADDGSVAAANGGRVGIPAEMKAWVDQVCRAGRTFRFTETGPEGLVHAERAWIVTASGGTVIRSPVDFNTGYLRAILGFLGVHDVRVVAAEQLQLVGEAGVAKAYADLDTHALI